MLSLRQVQSADVSDLQADPHALSKEWRLTDSFTQNAFRLSIALRQIAVLIGIASLFFGALCAIAQVLSACVLYLPAHRYFALNTWTVFFPALCYFGFALITNKQFSAKHQLVMSGLSLAVTVSVAALALRLQCQSVAVIVPTLAILAAGVAASSKALIEVVPQLPAVKNYGVFNSYFCTGSIFCVLAAIFSIKTISIALPAGLEIGASFILLGCAVLSKTLPELNDSEVFDGAQAQPFSSSSMHELLPFFVPASMTALPVFNVLVLALERNWVLYPQLLHSAGCICVGAFLGLLLSLSPVARSFQLSQHAMPGLSAFALAVVLAITPGDNQGFNCDISLALLGALFVYTNVQLLTRAQSLFDRDLLNRAASLSLFCLAAAVAFFATLIQPFLDTISATMLTRFLGLEIVVVGSAMLTLVLSWQSRLMAISYIQQPVSGGNQASHDFHQGVIASGLPTD